MAMADFWEERRGATQRALLLADRSDPHLALAQHLSRDCGWLVDHLTGPLDTRDMARYANASLVVATPAMLGRLEPGLSLHLLRQLKVILLVSRERLLETADFAQLADGFLFYEVPDSLLCEALRLADNGQCICPPYIAPGFSLDDARAEKIAALSASELAVLDRLAEGDPNLAIAEQLGLQEREVKYLVRSLLTKLHFANRTEAGVFAMRYRESIHAAQAQGGGGEAGHDGDSAQGCEGPRL